MKQANIATLAVLGGALILSLGGITTLACSGGTPAASGSSSGGSSGSSGGSGSSSGASSGSSSGGSGSSGGSEGSGSGSSGSSSGGASVDAGTTCKIPSLHPNVAGDVFCGFSDAGDLDCLSDSGTPQCCLGGTVATNTYAPEVCAPFGEACTNGAKAVAIECGQTSDCTANGMAGAVCCLQGVTAGPAAIAGCPATDLKQSGGTAVKCEVGDAGLATTDAGEDGGSSAGLSSCAPGEYQLCAQQTDCPTGKTCTPLHWKLYDIGFCM